MLNLGYADVDITPETSVELVGFNRPDTMSKGILSPLMAQVSVWGNSGYCCLITIDSLGFMKEIADILRTKVADLLRVSKDKVMLCFSHSHSAPNVATSPAYFEKLCRNVLVGVVKAVSAMKPVRVGCINAEVDIGVNRRKESNRVDKRAGLLKACDYENGHIRLIMIRLTAHCNVLKRDNLLISSDYFGTVREKLQSKYKCPVMVIQGAAGNVAPKYFNSVLTPVDASGDEYVRSETALQDMAEAVLDKIEQNLRTCVVLDTNELAMFSKEIILRAPVPSLEKAEKLQKEAKEKTGIDGSGWLVEIRRLHECGIFVQKEKVEVQYFMIANFLLCGVPYELVTEFALVGMEKTGNKFLYINGYTNGCSSYFPTEEIYDNGGYEVYYSMMLYYKYHKRVFPFERDSAGKLIDFMIENAPFCHMKQKSV